VASDLLGAARSLFGREAGIACIMGTGSNSCSYDGNLITHNVSPLGFIVGDEGSGAVLCKLFIADCLKNQIPTTLQKKFLSQYDLTPALILENVYKKPFPNRFLAQFTPFLLENLHEPTIYKLVLESFEAFIKRNILQYDLKDIKIGCVGSVAFYFKTVLEEAALKYGLKIDNIVQDPMNGLVKYHA
jgi:N-acetylglucosamine kinase-like BadF-type ATPase